MNPNFYRAFEDRYRGSRELIKERLRAYLGFIVPAPDAAGRAPAPMRAIDLGCGRGEWLELLGDHGISAHGVDLDDGMLQACREHGLDVETAEAVASLRKLAPDSVSVVSAFHLVEHIPFEALQALVSEALRVLTPGGLLILETPNPENLMVGASRFYLDPSHLRPLPPMLLGFLAEHTGFARHKIVPLQENTGLRFAKAVRLIDVLDGASPDYGMVAQKAGPVEITAPIDSMFASEYGLSVEELSRRFDDNARQLHDAQEQRLHSIDVRSSAAAEVEEANRKVTESWKAHLQHRLEETNVSMAGLDRALAFRAGQIDTTMQRLNALEARLSQGEAHRDDIETHLADAQAKLDEAQAQLLESQDSLRETQSQLSDAQSRLGTTEATIVSLLSSRSWRFTAPMRRVMSALKRAVS